MFGSSGFVSRTHDHCSKMPSSSLTACARSTSNRARRRRNHSLRQGKHWARWSRLKLIALYAKLKLKEAETKLEAAQKALDEMAKAHALRDAFDVVDSRQSFVISICNFQVEHAGSASAAHTASRRLIRLLCFRFELVRSLTHHFHLGLGTG